jgi:hypothetical protein
MRLERAQHVPRFEQVTLEHTAVVEPELQPHEQADAVVAQHFARTVDEVDRKPRPCAWPGSLRRRV